MVRAVRLAGPQLAHIMEPTTLQIGRSPPPINHSCAPNTWLYGVTWFLRGARSPLAKEPDGGLSHLLRFGDGVL
jgi:hypothetical protein